MNNVFNREKEKWIRPWNQEKFDDLYNRDERYFAILVKGLISWLNRNIVMYNKPINHFIFNTGSSYLYIESNGYEYSVSEVTGEDTIYMSLPRCILEITNIKVPPEELSMPFSRGNYERRNGNQLSGYNAEIQRMPIEISINAKYYLATFNEEMILAEEIINKLMFQQYFNITYLGNIIQCSIEFPSDLGIQINKIDMASAEPNQRTIELSLIVCSNYPNINERTEIPTDRVIVTYGVETDLYRNEKKVDVDKKGKILNNNLDEYEQFVEKLSNDDLDDDNINENTPKETLIEKYDINNDGVVDKNDAIDILEQIKFDSYIKKDTNGDMKIDYEDLLNIIKAINAQEGVNVHYDRFMRKLYISYDNGNEEEIDISKYKIE